MSRPYQIRDAMLRIIGDVGKYKTVRKTPVPQLQPAQLPALSVFVMACNGRPDGDGNAGQIALNNSDAIAVSVCRGFDDVVVLEGGLDQEVDDIKQRLLTDPGFTKLGPDGLWESIAQITRQWFFPKDGEAYFAELRMVITFNWREGLEPVIVDDFKGITLTARPMLNPDAPLITQHIDPAQS